MPTHKGQIAFPGGKAQKEDLDIVDTAVREASEELLISKDALSPFGILNGYDTREFQYPVFPVVCKLDSVDLSIFDTSEVQKITDDFTKKIEEIVVAKKNEILTV